MSINLHIEKIVLDGVSLESHQHGMLKQALQAELTRLLASEGLGAIATGDMALRSVHAQSIEFNKGDNASQLGNQVAQAVHESIGRGIRR